MENIFVDQPGSVTRGVRKAYQLMFKNHCGDTAKIVRFDSDDGHEAFTFAQREMAGRTTELWLDDRPVCGLTRDEDDVWSIRPAEPAKMR